MITGFGLDSWTVTLVLAELEYILDQTKNLDFVTHLLQEV